MSRIIARAFFVLLLFPLLIACGGGGGEYTPPPGGGGTQYGAVRLNNASGVTIDEFYLTPSSSSSWGVDQLGSGTLPTGSFFDVSTVPVGTYDARAVVLGVFSIYHGDSYGFSVTANSTYNISAGPSSFTGSLEIVNDTAAANIIALYVVPSSSATWGSNQISSPIGPGGSQHLYYMSTGSYDVKVVWNTGPDSIYFNNTISSLTLLTLLVI
jgi:hypothetical protein